MKPLHLHSYNDYTPTVHLDAGTGILHFSGTCLMRHIWQVSCPVLEWTNNYLATKPKQTTVVLNLDRFNVVTTKFLWNFLRKLEEYYEASGNQVILYWNFDLADLEMQQILEEFQQAFSFPVKHTSLVAIEVA
ncbi:MAG: SiaC family regulatory phosphoprotein [Flammeovirgaceae bacterium]